jgi:hypothetical protein
MIVVELFINNIFFKKYKAEDIEEDKTNKYWEIGDKYPKNISIQLDLEDSNLAIQSKIYNVELKRTKVSCFCLDPMLVELFHKESKGHDIYPIVLYPDASIHIYFQAFIEDETIVIKSDKLYLQ